LLIHALGPQGDGIHRAAAGPVYVARALPGETVRVDVRAEKSGGGARGELIAIVTPGPDRVPAPCPHYDVCGGCTLQHAAEAFYRDWKVGIVRDALRKKGLQPATWHAPVFVPPGTRRRATFAARKVRDHVTLGYFRRRSHDIADIDACLMLAPEIMALRAILGPLLAPIVQEDNTADVFIQMVGGRFDIAITGPVGATGRPDLAVHEAFAVLARTPTVDRVTWRRRAHDAPETMAEVNPLRARFGLLEVVLPPLAFLQPTQAGEAVLVNAVMDLLPMRGRFADLFAGCGTFAGHMLARGPVAAFEGDAAAVDALGRATGTAALTAHRRDLFREPLRPDQLAAYDAVVFDPPRAGAHEQAKALAESRVPVVIGVSCNPATFARDARILADGGYRLTSARVIDQFTWSHHVELVASFVKAS
jgi:23S rRNA (uracil1939-C5)-methyltransferase